MKISKNTTQKRWVNNLITWVATLGALVTGFSFLAIITEGINSLWSSEPLLALPLLSIFLVSAVLTYLVGVILVVRRKRLAKRQRDLIEEGIASL